jgi:hypothetical protein
VRDLCAARLSDAPRILGSSPSGCTRLVKSIGYALHNGVDLRAYLMVPEPEHVVSCIAQKLSSAFVAGQFVRVLGTIYLDNELRLWAEEICEEWPDRMLTAELKSNDLAPAQARPQTVLPFGLFTS